MSFLCVPCQGRQRCPKLDWQATKFVSHLQCHAPIFQCLVTEFPPNAVADLLQSTALKRGKAFLSWPIVETSLHESTHPLMAEQKCSMCSVLKHSTLTPILSGIPQMINQWQNWDVINDESTKGTKASLMRHTAMKFPKWMPLHKRLCQQIWKSGWQAMQKMVSKWNANAVKTGHPAPPLAWKWNFVLSFQETNYMRRGTSKRRFAWFMCQLGVEHRAANFQFDFKVLKWICSVCELLVISNFDHFWKQIK